MKALVLSGGGARGSYQVGVLTAVAEIATRLKVRQPFQIFTGVSAGAINASVLAAGADDFAAATRKLADIWSHLHSEQVFKTDAISLGKIGFKWVGELSLGGFTGSTPGKSLLDTSPLGDLIRNNLDFGRIDQHIQSKILHAIGITALDYATSTAITFVEGAADCPYWERARRRSEKTQIRTEHILASSAIPLLFTPAQVENRYFGDGCIRNQTPLSPALHLGAENLLVIGVRQGDLKPEKYEVPTSGRPPSVAKVINVLLNSILLDGIDIDVERLNKINEFLRKVPEQHQSNVNFRKVNYVWVSPSVDIGGIASQMSSRLPRLVRYLLKGLGPLEDASEIISYLLFEPEFCSRLIEVGYQDGMSYETAIEEFLVS